MLLLRTEREQSSARLLPWTSPEGKPCYVVGDGTGYVWRMADDVECVQLGMADDLLGHADALLAERRATGVELRYLARRLVESLRDVRRVAESRGARLGGRSEDGAAFRRV
ncbi:hypothetical protein [Streptomyces soliscabiei]|uniref:hypothetical protein n=1 Tax=Streptomyces soliscabiei TaxID=588897 RepID=UPI0029A94897|nr:hypothetical protein [Streptomyces sp. NY05-11A]MDX2679611.1 hypothetical protein [Streptomyces sp. NY05-11A]